MAVLDEKHELYAKKTTRTPVRIAIVLDETSDLNSPALRYLILHLNTLQGVFEYELHRADGVKSDLLPLLRSRVPIERGDVRRLAPTFVADYQAHLSRVIDTYGLKEGAPDRFIVISLAAFRDNFYSMKDAGLVVLALKNWTRDMAPPSFVEYILTLILRYSVSFACPALSGSIHLGTKGCLFDFTRNITEVRYKALQGFVCNHCRSALAKDDLHELADELVQVLEMKWVGSPSETNTPANISANLGFNLFRTKGIKPTWKETVLTALQTEAGKQIVIIAVFVLFAVVSIWFNLSHK
jgi:hypothetical protein